MVDKVCIFLVFLGQAVLELIGPAVLYYRGLYTIKSTKVRLISYLLVISASVMSCFTVIEALEGTQYRVTRDARQAELAMGKLKAEVAELGREKKSLEMNAVQSEKALFDIQTKYNSRINNLNDLKTREMEELIQRQTLELEVMEIKIEDDKINKGEDLIENKQKISQEILNIEARNTLKIENLMENKHLLIAKLEGFQKDIDIEIQNIKESLLIHEGDIQQYESSMDAEVNSGNFFNRREIKSRWERRIYIKRDKITELNENLSSLVNDYTISAIQAEITERTIKIEALREANLETVNALEGKLSSIEAELKSLVMDLEREKSRLVRDHKHEINNLNLTYADKEKAADQERDDEVRSLENILGTHNLTSDRQFSMDALMLAKSTEQAEIYNQTVSTFSGNIFFRIAEHFNSSFATLPGSAEYNKTVKCIFLPVSISFVVCLHAMAYFVGYCRRQSDKN